MKKICFAGKFNLKSGKEKLSKRLIDDYRSKILGDSEKLTYASKNLRLKDYGIIYHGCFYCEEASNGDFTSSDCDCVVSAETREVLSCDIFCCVFDSSFSTGSVVELMDAMHAKKRVAIFYKNEETSYKIKSEYWFAITRAMHIAKENKTEIEIYSYENDLMEQLLPWLSKIEKEI